MNIELHDRWTPAQTLRILDCLRALHDAIWEAREDELLFHIDRQVDRMRRKHSAIPPLRSPCAALEVKHQDNDGDPDLPF
jgi:hypothetical protein